MVCINDQISIPTPLRSCLHPCFAHVNGVPLASFEFFKTLIESISVIRASCIFLTAIAQFNAKMHEHKTKLALNCRLASEWKVFEIRQLDVIPLRRKVMKHVFSILTATGFRSAALRVHTKDATTAGFKVDLSNPQAPDRSGQACQKKQDVCRLLRAQGCVLALRSLLHGDELIHFDATDERAVIMIPLRFSQSLVRKPTLRGVDRKQEVGVELLSVLFTL